MGMAGPDANPNYLRRAFRWKCSHTFDGQKKGAELNGSEFFAQGRIDSFRHVPKEAQGEMHLCAVTPPHASNVRVKIDQTLSDGIGQIDRHKKSLAHRKGPC